MMRSKRATQKQQGMRCISTWISSGGVLKEQERANKNEEVAKLRFSHALDRP